MSGVITLLTDFGQRDAYVAEMKGVLVSGAPHASLIDISHDVPMGDVMAGAYLLSRTWHRFPHGTVHLAVVDPGVGSGRRAIALSRGSHFFVGPDNGIFTSMLLGATVIELGVSVDAAPTFHGRDVFAPAAVRLAAGASVTDLGEQIQDPVALSLPRPTQQAGRTTGRVVFVDHFGNLVTDLPGTWVTPETEVMVGGIAVGSVKSTYGDAEPGEFVAYIGSAGTLEIAVRDGSAADRSGVRVGGEVVGITV